LTITPAGFAFRYNRRYSRHRGLLFYRLAERAMQTEPKPYVELLSAASSKRRKRKVTAAAARTALLGWSVRRRMCHASNRSGPAGS
jgi:hypothetical protein